MNPRPLQQYRNRGDPNSDERCDAPKCHPETRTAVQEDIISWITTQRIMWLSGPAGAGKTAIAGSVAETCEDMGLLAGSFFFRHSQGLRPGA
ncbi:hypothetical protein FA13DRAFT_1645330 [Coprinellus micaceus]|uniref:Nephrocystin 3-like N-terminal domain-containing protein n=1 Tax=Coprinellus micaceus TaxID=71717 RepID=A0A4Y7SEI5_COPMI|nr:hypothetical protein FA13DRAFT_1645330 [Coprinellus micaceus]